jgi:hypothetical protein
VCELTLTTSDDSVIKASASGLLCKACCAARVCRFRFPAGCGEPARGGASTRKPTHRNLHPYKPANPPPTARPP